MSVIALVLLSVLVGWLATLTLQCDVNNLFARDFTIAASAQASPPFSPHVFWESH